MTLPIHAEDDDALDILDEHELDALDEVADGAEGPSSSHALVPYQEPGLPALTESFDLQAFIRQAERAPLLTAQEEYHLAKALKEHDDLEAAQQLIVSHLRLVVRIARGYLGYGLPFSDLIQEGNIGLMKAIRNFDPERRIRLMTFAQHWIKSEIQEYIVRNWRLVKLATTKNQRKLFFNLRKFKDDPQRTLTYQEAQNIADTLQVKPQEVLEMEQRLYGQEQSFDAPAHEDDDAVYAPSDWLSDERDNPSLQYEEKSQADFERQGLRQALAELDPRQRRVIEARYLALDEDGNPQPETLQSLANELGVSAERIRQIEKAALKKMRTSMLRDLS